jgi:hypothetical protein
VDTQIKVDDIYDKNLNFLIGSGASYGLFPTLGLSIGKTLGETHTVETIATHLEQSEDQDRLALLFMHYYRSCIRPVCSFALDSITGDLAKEQVVANYELFVRNILRMLEKRQPLDKRCNLFTTNYDGCLPLVADRMLRRGEVDFVLNDGARGFQQRTLRARNFDSFLCQVGVFDQHHSSIPQINVVNLHGSVYWKKFDKAILVSYTDLPSTDIVPAAAEAPLQAYSAVLNDSTKGLAHLPPHKFRQATLSAFWEKYNQLPIVNPTKWKFHETVFEEHYYQMLRLLSYELEKPNAVLITFGFSFADEHILNLVQRSLSNPGLQVFVGCFDAAEVAEMEGTFRLYKNVTCFSASSGTLDFSAFNGAFASIGSTGALSAAGAP